jgi:hypothetical protein
MMTTNDSKRKVEEKIGESPGLEMAAQKAVEELGSKGSRGAWFKRHIR